MVLCEEQPVLQHLLNRTRPTPACAGGRLTPQLGVQFAPQDPPLGRGGGGRKKLLAGFNHIPSGPNQAAPVAVSCRAPQPIS